MKYKTLTSGFGLIRTTRLELRPYTRADYVLWAAGWRNRKLPQNAFDLGLPPTKDLSRRAYLGWLKSKDELRKRDLQYVYGVFHRTTKVHLGTVEFFILARASVQCANIGYQIHNNYWGNGYGKEAVKAATILAFKRLKLHRLEAGIMRTNKASIALIKAVGARREGTRKKFYFDNKQWSDLEIYVLYAEDAGLSVRPTFRTSIREYWKRKTL